MSNFPEIVTFRITSRCNNNCKYCFAPKNIKEMGFSELKKLFYLFQKRGVKAVVLTGGEPLLRENISDIFKELKKCNIKIFLDTNGDLFFNYKDKIDKYVDVLGLPIDFPDSSYRNKKNLNTIIKILNYYKNKNLNKPIIRIGTIVTKDNINKLISIGELLKNYPVDIWKIYEFTPQNINAIKNKLALAVSQKEFEEAVRIKDKFLNLKLVISKRKDRSYAYFFINPDGIVFMPIDDLNICKEKIIGNIFDEDIIERWEKEVSQDNYLNNAKETFNYNFS